MLLHYDLLSSGIVEILASNRCHKAAPPELRMRWLEVDAIAHSHSLQNKIRSLPKQNYDQISQPTKM